MNYRILLLSVAVIAVLTAGAYATIAPHYAVPVDYAGVRSGLTEGEGESESAETKTYTLEEVAEHTERTDCWTAVDGVVYDLTPFIAQHPGGAANIMKICGIDGTSAFADQHGGQSRPESTLENFFIGVLR